MAVTLILARVTLVFRKVAPKRGAMQRAERWGSLAARPLALLSTLTRPALWSLPRATDVAVWLMGGDPGLQREDIAEEDLRDMVASQPTITDKQRLIIDGAFEISERSLNEVLRPRREVFVVDGLAPAKGALDQLAASGHSRAPVGAQGALDDVVRVVHLRDLPGDGDRPPGEAASELCAFPESVGVLDAPHERHASRVQMAVVVDEHGSASGIVNPRPQPEESGPNSG